MRKLIEGVKKKRQINQYLKKLFKIILKIICLNLFPKHIQHNLIEFIFHLDKMLFL